MKNGKKPIWIRLLVFAVLLLVFLTGLVLFVWRQERPMDLNPQKLSPAQTQAGYPGVEMRLSAARYRLDITLTNQSDAVLDFGASVGQKDQLFVDGRLEAFLEGQWYEVPQDSYASSGVGVEVEPGDTFQAQVHLSLERMLPDGQYRLAFGYRCQDPEGETPVREQPWYCAYDTFEVIEGIFQPLL